MNQSQISQSLLDNREMESLQKSNKRIMAGIIVTSVLTLVLVVLMAVFVVNYSKSHKAELEKFQELQEWRELVDNFPYQDYNFSHGIMGKFQLNIDAPAPRSPIRKFIVTNDSYLTSFTNNIIPGLQELVLEEDEIVYFQNNYLPDLHSLTYKMKQSGNITLFINNYLPLVEELELTAHITQFRANTLSVRELIIATKSFVHNDVGELENLTIIAQTIVDVSHNNFTNLHNIRFELNESKLEVIPRIMFAVNQFSTYQRIVHTFNDSDHRAVFTQNNYNNTQSITFGSNAHVIDFLNNYLPKVTEFTFQSPQTQLDEFQFNVFESLRQLNFPQGTMIKEFSYNQFPKITQFTLTKSGLFKFIQNKFDELETLNLSHNDLFSISFESAPKLRTLDISYSNYLMQLDSLDLPSLQTLIVESSPFLAQIANTQMGSLKYLKGAFCNIHDIHDLITANLVEVDLQFNNLNYFLPQFPSLVKLNLSNNQVNNFYMEECGLLEILQLQNNKIKGFMIKNSSSLKYLDLSQNQLNEFHDGQFSSLDSTETILLNNNPLLVLSIHAQNLVTLQARGTSLTQIGMINAPKLQRLDITDNSNISILSNINSDIQQILMDHISVKQFYNNYLPNAKGLDLKLNFDNLEYLYNNTLNFSSGTDHVQTLDFSSPTLTIFKDNTLILDDLKIDDQTTSLLQILNNQFSFTLPFFINSPNLKIFKNNTIARAPSMFIRNTSLESFTDNTLNDVQHLIIQTGKLSSFKGNTIRTLTTLKLSDNQLNDSVVDEIIAMNLESVKMIELVDNPIEDKEQAKSKLKEKYPEAFITV